jgi:hypothetical protein
LPIKITKILTGMTRSSRARFTSKDKQPSGRHGYRTPLGASSTSTNRMVERFNGRISELLSKPA